MDKEGQNYHTIGDKYVRAVATTAGCLPLMLPSLGEHLDATAIVRRMDGIVLTGSPSNVHPENYGTPAHEKAEPYDTWRDEVTLPLIRAALAEGVPLLAICRGMQEFNVALGGSLYARVHEEEGRRDHRRPRHPDLDVQYGPAHDVTPTHGGLLAQIVGAERLRVNSLHWQGIAHPAPELQVEALAEDGTIEAISLPTARAFALGIQWHPEYKPQDSAASMQIFEAFADAARNRSRRPLPV